MGIIAIAWKYYSRTEYYIIIYITHHIFLFLVLAKQTCNSEKLSLCILKDSPIIYSQNYRIINTMYYLNIRDSSLHVQFSVGLWL